MRERGNDGAALSTCMRTAQRECAYEAWRSRFRVSLAGQRVRIVITLDDNCG